MSSGTHLDVPAGVHAEACASGRIPNCARTVGKKDEASPCIRTRPPRRPPRRRERAAVSWRG